jgi:hypothetical protein
MTKIYLRKDIEAWVTSKGVQVEVEAQTKTIMGLFRSPGAAYSKTGLTTAYKLEILCSLYAQKRGKNTFLMELVSGPNSGGADGESSEEVGVQNLFRCCIAVFWYLYLFGAH